MSRETREWLNSNILTGFDYKTWHHTEGVSKVFAGAIPLDEASALMPTYVEELPDAIPNHKKIIPVRDGQFFLDGDGVAAYAVHGRTSYAMHQPIETVLPDSDNVLLAQSLISCGVLRNGMQVWAQYGSPDEVQTSTGVRFTVKLLVTTAADGGVSGFKFVKQFSECDNTLEIAKREKGVEGKAKGSVRHTRYSVLRVENMRREFGLLGDIGVDAEAEILADVQHKVSAKEVDAFLAELFPATVVKEPIPRTTASEERKRDAVMKWANHQFAPWKGTAFGLLQSFDAANRWDFKQSGDLNERNMNKVIVGDFDRDLARARRVLTSVQ